uniref:Uncharacterized protein n=1 Tax=viral metagenome TaxID=1070528 RepID=A0A6M3XKQ9_9ZZZZ
MTLNLNDLVRGGTACFSKAGLAEGTNDHTIKTAAPNGAGVDFAINGLSYHKADTDNIAPTVCDEQALGTTCLYVVTLQTDGDVVVTKGNEVDNDDLSGGYAVLDWPTPPAGECPVGAIKVAAGTTAFTVGVDDITDDVGTGTITFYDFFAVPAAPLTS